MTAIADAEKCGHDDIMHGGAATQYSDVLMRRRSSVDWPRCPYRRPDRRAAWHQGVDAACEEIRDGFRADWDE
jgi:hypothetical protein